MIQTAPAIQTRPRVHPANQNLSQIGLQPSKKQVEQLLKQ